VILRLALVAVVLVACDAPAVTTDGNRASASLPVVSSGEASPPGTPVTSAPSASGLAIPGSFPVYPVASPFTPSEAWAIGAWSTGDAPPAVYDFYLDALPAAGFELDLAAPGGEVAIIRFSSQDGASYQLDLVGSDPVLITLGVPHD